MFGSESTTPRNQFSLSYMPQIRHKLVDERRAFHPADQHPNPVPAQTGEFLRKRSVNFRNFGYPVTGNRAFPPQRGRNGRRVQDFTGFSDVRDLTRRRRPFPFPASSVRGRGFRTGYLTGTHRGRQRSRRRLDR